MANKIVLITGGAGFVGRRFVKKFLEKGYHVECVDNLYPGSGAINPNRKKGWPLFNPYDYKKFKFIKSDCRSYFKKNKKYFDYVLHLAAIVGGREVIENNPLAVAEDLSIDSSFWQWAKIAKPRKNICFSSSAVYPIDFQKYKGFKLLKEDQVDLNKEKNFIGKPDLTYGWSKLTHEYLAKIAYERHNLKSIVYRPFSGYGEDQDLNYPVPSIVKRVVNNKKKKTIHIWGSGKQKRDFIYIDDCVDAVMSTKDLINDGSSLNLSSGKYTSFFELTKLLCNICGYKSEIIPQNKKPEGVFARAGCTKKLRKYGYRLKTSLEEGMTKVIKYYEKKD